MRKGVIYKITSPSNRIYIGQTLNKINGYKKNNTKFIKV